MNKFYNFYFQILNDYAKSNNLDKKEVKLFINEIETMPQFQCFDFILIMLKNNYSNIIKFELLFYKSMMHFVGLNKITKDVILKLAVSDLCNEIGEDNLFMTMMLLDSIHLEYEYHKPVEYNSIKNILLASEYKICNLMGRNFEDFINKWDTIVKNI